MNRQEHPAWEDELMPFIDGQLDAVQAAGIAEHLENCEDCAASVAETRRLSQQVTAWGVDDPSAKMKERIFAELQSRNIGKKPRERWFGWTKKAWALSLSGAFAGVVLIFVSSTYLRNTAGLPAPSSLAIEAPGSSPQAAPSPVPEIQEQDFKSLSAVVLQQQGQGQGQGQQSQQRPPTTDIPAGPMIIRSARLRIIARDFEEARSKLEAIVMQSQGYLDQMTVKGESGSGRVLSARLRLPSDRLDSGLSDLRKLGKVQEESQNSSDVTSQYVDLRARLTNARNSESRLQTILKERTGKLSDVVDLEREISRVREDIERMEAQQKEMSNQVQYATIQIEMSEEYHAQLVPSVPSAGTSLWNASVDGYHTAEDSLLGLALFLLRYGPALILWSALLLPIALFVRRLRRVGTQI